MYGRNSKGLRCKPQCRAKSGHSYAILCGMFCVHRKSTQGKRIDICANRISWANWAKWEYHTSLQDHKLQFDSCFDASSAASSPLLCLHKKMYRAAYLRANFLWQITASVFWVHNNTDGYVAQLMLRSAVLVLDGFVSHFRITHRCSTRRGGIYIVMFTARARRLHHTCHIVSELLRQFNGQLCYNVCIVCYYGEAWCVCMKCVDKMHGEGALAQCFEGAHA